MQKQGKSRKSLIIGIVAAVVILAALLALLLTQCVGFGGQNTEPSTEDTSNVVPTYDLYWNLDRAEYAGKSEAGMSSREPEADGYFYVRFAYNGEQVTFKVKERKLINAIDAADIVGLEFDKDGVVVKVLQLDDMPLEKVAWKFYVQSVGGKVIKANSSDTYEGMEAMLTNNNAIIMDVVGKEGPAGCLGNPVEGDRIYAIANKAGELTHVFIYERPTYMLYHEDYCEHCKETVSWGEWVRTDIMPTKTGHYQLQNDVQLKKQQTMNMDDQKICLDLNGKRVDGATNARVYSMHTPGSSLALMDTSEEKTGKLVAHGDGDQGMCVWVRYGQFHMYAGTLDGSDAKSDLNGVAVNVRVNSYFYMYGGTIIGGRAYPCLNKDTGKYTSGLGGSMSVSGKFVMNGGVIRDGYAESVNVTNKDGSKAISRGLGGNIFVAYTAELELNGGVIKNGIAGNLAGNIYMDGACTVTINGTRIEGGKTLGKEKSAGSIMVGSSKGNLIMNSGSIVGGTSYNTGGNVYCQGNFTMNGGTISGGKCYSYTTGELKADSNNYNVRIYNGKFVMNGGRIHGGVGFADSSTTDKYQATLILGGNAVIKSDDPNTSNLFISTGGNPKIVVNKMGAKASIGVTTMRGVFTEPTQAQNATAFFSDVEGAEVLHTEQGLALGRFGCVCGKRSHTNGCDGTQYLWAPWVYKASLPVSEGNYFLTKDVTTTYGYWVAKESTVRLDLNGKNVTFDVPNHYGDGFRMYISDWKSTLVITDTTDKPGTLRTEMGTPEEVKAALDAKVAAGELTQDEADKKANNQKIGNTGMILWGRGGDIILHNGILDNSANSTQKNGMTVYLQRYAHNNETVASKFTMYGGIIKGGTTTSYGASICGGKETEINIHGGIIENGVSTNSVGGNIYVAGKFYMDGGIVRNGVAKSGGGNLYIESSTDKDANGKITKYLQASAVFTGSAQILNGVTGDAKAEKDWGRGGNIRLVGVSGIDTPLTIDGNAVISGGQAIRSASKKAGNGGNIQTGGNTTVYMKGGTISKGSATSSGGNIFMSGKLVMSGGKIEGGTGKYGGNIYAYNGAEITMSGGTITKGVAPRGGNMAIDVAAKDVKFTMTGGTISEGKALTADGTEGRGGNIWAYAASKNDGVVKITVDGGRITDGQSTADGGNIYISGLSNNTSTVTIKSGVVSGGKTVASSKGGGVIYANNNTKLNVEGGAILGGESYFGGTVELYNGATLNMTGGVIAGGKANRGAVLAAYSSSSSAATVANISGGTITGGEGARGNIWLYGEKSNDRVELNISGKANIGGKVTVEGDTYAGVKNADLGGNIYAAARTHVTVKGGVIENGSATTNGGNIYTSNSSLNSLTISGGVIRNGHADDDGGNIFAGGKLNISGGAVVNGTAASMGGNIAFKTPSATVTFTMSGGTVAQGTASNGGNLWAYAEKTYRAIVNITGGSIGGTVTVDGVEYKGNTASGSGGNIYLENKADLTISAGKIENGTSRKNGGNIYAAGGSTVKLEKDGVIGAGTCANGYHGGSVYMNTGTRLTIEGGKLYGGRTYADGQTASSNGGALYLKGSATMTGGAIIGGKSKNGGAVCVDGGTFTLEDGAIVGGQAVNGGGNVAVMSTSSAIGSFVMEGGTISGGTAKNGGNVWLYGANDTHKGSFQLKAGSIGGSVEVADTTYAGGTASNNGGNVLATTQGKLTVNGGQIVGGVCSNNGGNIMTDASSSVFEMTGGTISDGTAPKDVNANVYLYNGKATISGGTIAGGYMVKDVDKAELNLSGTATIKGETGKPGLTLGDDTSDVLACVVNVGAMTEGADGAQVYISVPSGDKDFATATADCGNSWNTTILSAEGKTIYQNSDVLTFIDPASIPTPGPNPDEPDPDEPTAGTLTEHCVCGADRFGGEHAPNCDKTKLQWTEWTDALAEEQNGSGKTAANSLPTVSGKYYLTKGVDLAGQFIVESEKAIYLDLNSNYVKAPSNNRAFYLNNAKAKLIITDSSDKGEGYVQGGDLKDKSGATIYIDTKGGQVTLFRGAIRGGSVTRTGASNALAGTIYMSAGAFTVNGGTVEAGQLTPGTGKSGYGAVAYMTSSCEMQVNGGTIIAGEAKYGGACYLLSGPSFEMTGGKILGGKGSRGAILAVEANAKTATATITGGTITGGDGERGNIWAYGNKSDIYATVTIGGTANIGGSVTLDDTTYSGVKNASTGGNIYIGQNAELVMNGGVIENGTASSKGGNIYADNGSTSKVTINAGTVRGGTATDGANIYCNGPMTVTGGTIEGGVVFATKLTVSGNPVINAENKTNVYVKSGKTITVGALEDGAKIGVTLEDETAVFTGAVDEAYAKYFLSDNKSKAVAHKAEGLYLIDKPNNVYCVCGATKIGGDHAPNCDKQEVEWTEWTDALAEEQNGAGKTAANSLPTVSGKYYLTKNVDGYYCKISTEKAIYLDLNGCYVKAPTNDRAFYINHANAQLVITDSSENGAGYIQGGAVSNKSSSTIYLDANGGNVTLFRGSIKGGSLTRTDTSNATGGTIYMSAGTVTINGGTLEASQMTASSSKSCLGAVIYVAANAQLNINGGTVIGGRTYADGATEKGNGGVAYVAGSVNVSGGTIMAGTSKYGGAFYVYNGGSFEMTNGKILGGKGSRGAILAVEANNNVATATITGGTITGGDADRGSIWVFGNKDNVYATLTVGGTANIGGSAVVDETTYSGVKNATTGGNIYLGKNTELTVGGNAVIENGTASGKGGNIYADNGTTSKVTINGGAIRGGTAAEGANIYCYGPMAVTGGTIDGGVVFGTTLTVSGKPVINAENKANIFVKTGKTITVGTLEDGAKIGVTLEDETAVFTGAVDEAYAKYFLSDNKSKAVAHKAEGLYLIDKPNNVYCVCGATKNGEECYEGFCDGTKQEWQAWDKTDAVPTEAGYWYLTGNVTRDAETTLLADSDSGLNVVLDLNGYNISSGGNRLYSTYTEDADKDLYPVNLVITNTYKPVDENDPRTGTVTISGSGNQGRAVWLSGKNRTVSIYNVDLTMADGATSNGKGAFFALTHKSGTTDSGNELSLYKVDLSNGKTTDSASVAYLIHGSELVMKDCAVTNCDATATGGAFYMYKATADISKTTFTNCDATGSGKSAGVAYVEGSDTTFTMTECTITNCTSKNYGGAFYVNTNGRVELSSTTITGCSTTSRAGAVYISEGTAILNGVTIDGCSTTGNSSRGGGIYNYKGTLEMTSCTIQNCNSGSDTTTGCLGGGVYQYQCTTKLGGKMVVKNNKQQGNQACDMYTNGAKVQILEGGLLAESEIGVRDGTNVVICDNITATDAGYFFSNGTLVPSHSGTTLKLVAGN